jgi:hypothetical protein
LQIQVQEAGEDLLIRQVRRPTVGGGDRLIQAAVGQVEPGGTLVVEIRQRPLFELFCRFFILGEQAGVADGAEAVGVWVVEVAGPGAVGGAGEFEEAFAAPFGGIQPRRPQPVQLPRRLGNRLPLGLARLREGECLEAGRGGVAESAFALAHLRSLCPRPDFMEPRVQDAEEVVVGPGKDDQLAIRKRWGIKPHEQTMLRDSWRGKEPW